LKFGTVSWELQTAHQHGFDREVGIDLQIIELAGKQATMVALQGGEADMAVTDWLWVSRQRASGRNFSFIPYSNAAGSLVVPDASPIRSLHDLRGKRVGIAGGALDKNWLLFRALAIKGGDRDLAATVTPVFGAPPLLNQQLQQGRVDALINFWPYVARLRAKGMRVVMDARDAAAQLGLDPRLPLIGYVFDTDWGNSHPGLIAAFLIALNKARGLLAESDAEWERLRPLMGAKDQATFEALRDGFRRGIPQPVDAATLQAAAHLAALLADVGGEALTGPAKGLSPGTFWGISRE
jgi:NitT/TauT family transport system substrate-binding protein